MPQLGLEVTEATVVEIRVGVGDSVEKDAPLIEMETDKALTEVVAPESGFVIAIDVVEGQVVAPGDVVARIGKSAAEEPTFAVAESVTAAAPASGSEGGRAPVAAGVGGDPGAESPRPRVAPVARRAAAKLGVELEAVTGSGPRGRITLRDVEAAAASRDGADSGAGAGSGAASEPETLALSGLRRAIARRMTESQQIPQYELQRDVDATHLLAQKEAVAASPQAARAGVTDLLIQAIAEMVARHEALAFFYADGEEPLLRRRPDIGVGLAVATDRGLVVPVVGDVPALGIGEIAARRGELVAAARAGRLSLEQMGGGTITLSNLGGFGVDRFKAMVNPGESAIVAVGRTADRVVPRGRAITVTPTLTLTMTFDHRAVDGAVGGAALAELAGLLEGGMTWRP